MANFDDEFEDLWRIAYRVAYRVLGVREDAEDVAQDALVRVGLKWRSVHEYAEPFTAGWPASEPSTSGEDGNVHLESTVRVRHRRCPTSTITTDWFALCDSSRHGNARS